MNEFIELHSSPQQNQKTHEQIAESILEFESNFKNHASNKQNKCIHEDRKDELEILWGRVKSRYSEFIHPEIARG
ncbi:unnamed protein product [Ceratitis capitata]|uniref:(Mediterranean fruit fly) hypothetical protein n=1 Tax=Ceratitis capitata TaxID=7213 RepID=A0A811U9X6_CERCA|nr:unnamed protein product [Ceratitis capitata]